MRACMLGCDAKCSANGWKACTYEQQSTIISIVPMYLHNIIII